MAAVGVTFIVGTGHLLLVAPSSVVPGLARASPGGVLALDTPAGPGQSGAVHGDEQRTGVCTVFFDVSYQSYLPALIGKDDLVDANGKLAATQSFAQVAGPGLGGALVGLVGAARAMSTDAISYAVSVASLLAIDARERPPEPGPRLKLGAEIAEG
jgi:Transmembrane secretion effector